MKRFDDLPVFPRWWVVVYLWGDMGILTYGFWILKLLTTVKIKRVHSHSLISARSNVGNNNSNSDSSDHNVDHDSSNNNTNKINKNCNDDDDNTDRGNHFLAPTSKNFAATGICNLGKFKAADFGIADKNLPDDFEEDFEEEFGDEVFNIELSSSSGDRD